MSHGSEKDGRTILITGCSKGSLGDALAREFLRKGCDEIATGRSLEKLQHLADLGIRIVELDLTSLVSIRNLCQQVTHLDILFNNAGIFKNALLVETSTEDFKNLFETNVLGAFELTVALVPLLVESKGIIVNHTSQSASSLGVTSGAYSATKAALANLTDNLRIELAPFGIRVSLLFTGGAASNFTRELPHQQLNPNSLYNPVRDEMEKFWGNRDFNLMNEDTHAKSVVGSIINRKNPPVWMWKGSLVISLYFIWLFGCFWKGYMDGLFSRLIPFNLLAKRLKEQSKSKAQ